MKASFLFAALFFSCSSALLGEQLFQLGNVKFKTDNQFYQFANVIRCASYKKILKKSLPRFAAIMPK